MDQSWIIKPFSHDNVTTSVTLMSMADAKYNQHLPSSLDGGILLLRQRQLADQEFHWLATL